MKREKEARLAVEREKRRAREIKKQERIAKMQQMAEQQIKKEVASTSSSLSGRAKKVPERYADGVSDPMLDLYTSDAMAGIYNDDDDHDEASSTTKKRKVEEEAVVTEIEYTFEEPVPQVSLVIFN